MATPKQIQINFSLSEDFRKSLHGKWVLKPEVFTKKAIASTLPEELHPQHKSEVEDLTSEFPEIPDPRYRTKEKVSAMQLSVKAGATWYDVLTSIVDDRTSTIEEPVIDLIGPTCQFTYTGKATRCDWTRYGIKIHFLDYDTTEDDTTEDDTIISASGSGDTIISASGPGKNQRKCHYDGDENEIVITIALVKLQSQFKLPDNTRLMSGIYSITSSQPILGPVTLELEHSLRTEDEASWLSRLSFVTASAISSRAVFEILPQGTFPPGRHYGRITLDHFSLFAIVLNLGEMIFQWMRQPTVHRYSCRYFKIHQRNCFEVHVVITHDLGVCKQEVENEFLARNAVYCPSHEVKFEGEEILLRVPRQGIYHRGWMITPLTHPEITKEAVDNYQPGMQIPSCSLKFKWTRDGPPVNETYTLILLGAREPYNYFNIDCELQQGINVVQPQPDITLLALMRINLHQEIGIHYREFGSFLLLDDAGIRVRCMEHRRMNDPQNINLDILQEWLEGRGRRPVTKETLVAVLRKIKLHTIADRVEQVQA